MNIRFPLFLVFTAVFLNACMSASNLYSDQPALVVQHQIENDAAVFKDTKIILIVPDHNFKNIKNDQLGQQIENSINAVNILKLPIIGLKQHEKIATSRGVKGELNRIKHNYITGITDEEIRKYAKKIDAYAILIPVLTIRDYSDSPVSVIYKDAEEKGDYYWPAFKVIEMQIKSEVNIKLRLVYVNSDKSSETVNISHEITDNYDTMETFKEKLKSINEESLRRSNENSRRKREEEQKRIEREREFRAREKNAKSKSDKFLLILDVATETMALAEGDDWCMLKPIEDKPNFKKSEYKDKNLLEKHLSYQAGEKAFKSYLTRFDGKTLKGDCVNGNGDFLFVNGDIYSGQWINGMAAGSGEYRYVDGALFNGMFVNGFADGNGSFTNKNGSVFTGPYKKGKKSGVGEFTLKGPEAIWYDANGFIITKYNYDSDLIWVERGVSYKVQCFDGYYRAILGKKEKKSAGINNN